MARSSLVKNKVLSLLITVSRQRAVKPLVSLCYRHIFPFLPIDRLCENTHWLAFHHPQPDYPLHILILPKREVSSLPNAPKDAPDLYADLFVIVQQLLSDFQLEDSAYRLVTNGGQNQAIPIWHWHLVCEASCKGENHPGVSHA